MLTITNSEYMFTRAFPTRTLNSNLLLTEIKNEKHRHAYLVPS